MTLINYRVPHYSVIVSNNIKANLILIHFGNYDQYHNTFILLTHKNHVRVNYQLIVSFGLWRSLNFNKVTSRSNLDNH